MPIENKITEEFLELYRQLEHDGRKMFFPNSSEKEGIMGRLIAVPQLKQYKEDLEYCRQVRNFLVHTPKVNGVYSIVPSTEMVSMLKNCVDRINNPLRAMDYAIKMKNMFFASLDDKILDITRYMSTRKFTHVPVFNKNEFIGVFSSDVLYCYMGCHSPITITGETELIEFLPHLPIHSHSTEYFAFVKSDITLHEVAKLFKLDVKSLKQLSAIFLTKNGKIDQPIEAMITPWSLLRDAPDL